MRRLGSLKRHPNDGRRCYPIHAAFRNLGIVIFATCGTFHGSPRMMVVGGSETEAALSQCPQHRGTDSWDTNSATRTPSKSRSQKIGEARPITSFAGLAGLCPPC